MFVTMVMSPDDRMEAKGRIYQRGATLTIGQWEGHFCRGQVDVASSNPEHFRKIAEEASRMADLLDLKTEMALDDQPAGL